MALATIKDYFPSVSGRTGKRGAEEAVDEASNGTLEDSVQEPHLRQKYETVFLGDLQPGPKRVTFMARIVNIFEQNSGKPPGGLGRRGAASGAASRCLKILAKDDSGSILIKLWYAHASYDLALGSLISIWAMHISAFKGSVAQKKPGAGAAPGHNISTSASACASHTPAIMTSIFPEMERGNQITIHRRSDVGIACRMPLGYREGQTFLSLDLLSEAYPKTMTGKGSKVLVFVKAIGGVKKYTNFQSQTVERLEVGVSDESGEAILTLYGTMMRSALAWTVNSTILLISNANWKANYKVFVNAMTFIEVDPDIIEADWLRKYAWNSAIYVNQPFPKGVFNVEAFEASPTRIKFTLAEIDEFARVPPDEDFMGYVCLVLMEINLVVLYNENRLFCSECCHMPIFSNSLTATCGQCDTDIDLRINPQIVGSVSDETGMISCTRSPQSSFLSFGARGRNKNAQKKGTSPLLWSPKALYELLGSHPADLLTVNGLERCKSDTIELLQEIEKRLSLSQIIALFGWYSHGAKLAICKVLEY